MSKKDLISDLVEENDYTDNINEIVPLLVKTHDKSLKIRRFLVVFAIFVLLCLANIGICWCSDTPASLQEQIMSIMNLSAVKFYTFYSVYSIPNIVLVLFGGMMVDRFIGMRLSTIVFASLLALGQFLFALGMYFNSYQIMVLARFIFGLGSESLSLALNKYFILWFDPKWLPLGFSIFLGVARILAFTMFNITPLIYAHFKNDSSLNSKLIASVWVMFLGFFLCCVGVLSSIILYYLDKKYRSSIDKESSSGSVLSELKDDFTILNKSFWLLSIICLFSYSGISPISGQLVIFLKSKYHFDSIKSSFCLSLSPLIGAGVSPILGLLIGQTGCDIIWLQISLIGLVAVQTMWLFSTLDPYIIISLQGIMSTLLSSVLWPMVSFIIPHNKIGTAYGVMQCLQNLGLAISPAIAGLISDNFGFFSFYLFLSGIVGSFLFNFLLIQSIPIE